MSISSTLTRREALASATGALAVLAAATSAAAETGSHDGHGSHDGAGHEMRHRSAFDAAMKCVTRGEECVPHCIALLGQGDTSLAACLGAVQQMIPACAALARFAAFDSARLKQLAEFCIGVCDDCEKECRKHEKHAVCKSCAESCAECSKACKALIKA
jgi:Cys-rich four helix bundle protein (predicted Tat secretion target)